MMKRLMAVPMLLLLAVFAGCVDLEQEITLNPDGSGRIRVHAVSTPQMDFGMDGPKASEDPHELARAAAEKEVNAAQGVDAWKDVSYGLRDDGLVEFSGTAYFPDIRQLKLNAMGMKGELLDMQIGQADNGAMTIDLQNNEKPGTKEPRDLTDAQVKEEMLKQRAGYQQMKGLMETFLKDMRQKTTFHLPGKVASSTNLQKTGDSSVTLTFSGQEVLTLLDTFMKDDAWLASEIRAGFSMKGGPGNMDAFNEKLFGEKGPVRVVTTADIAPQFDYTTEMEEARALQDDMFTVLGLFTGGSGTGGAPGAKAPPARGGEFKQLILAGVQEVYVASDHQRGISAFGNDKGLQLALVGIFDGAVLKVEEGKVTKATGEGGYDLLPDSEWDREISFPGLSDDGTTTAFTVKLRLPPKGVQQVREVSGELTYLTGSTTRQVDTGLSSFATQAEGTAYNTLVEELEWDGEYSTIKLKIDLNKATIQGYQFVDASGKTIPVEDWGIGYSGDTTWPTFRHEGEFPKEGKLLLTIYDDVQNFVVPFTITAEDIANRYHED